MKSKTLLLCVMTLFIISVNAQKKEKQITGYAITAVEKGGRNWKEVRLVDISTGQELRSVYQSSQETEALNARTGKPVVKKEITALGTPVGSGNGTGTVMISTAEKDKKKVVNLDDELNKANGNSNANANYNINKFFSVFKKQEKSYRQKKPEVFVLNYFFTFLKGIPNSFNNSNASSLVPAVVTKVISIPVILLILSISISGKMICSVIPNV